MTFNGWLQIAIYAVLVILITKPFGGYMTRVFNGRAHAAVAGAAPDRGRASTSCAASASARSSIG